MRRLIIARILPVWILSGCTMVFDASGAAGLDWDAGLACACEETAGASVDAQDADPGGASHGEIATVSDTVPAVDSTPAVTTEPADTADTGATTALASDASTGAEEPGTTSEGTGSQGEPATADTGAADVPTESAPDTGPADPGDTDTLPPFGAPCPWVCHTWEACGGAYGDHMVVYIDWTCAGFPDIICCSYEM